ncbi:MAG TPA: transglycosylase SLT domain-containing protein [Casimicrobiaceae bacterium]|nr:transglycosylase SLT domain-containing protein [Casimicrobiaceae bacterium]
MHRFHSFALACALLLTAFAGPAGAQGDADFLAARAAFDRGDRARLDALAGKLSAHVLQPYVAYWQLKLRLDTAEDDEVRAFLARWRETPLADRLRVEWLKALAKRGRWTTFGAEYAAQAGEDIELACYAIQYRWSTEGEDALKAAKPLWFTDKTTPDSCDLVFAALIARKSITTEDRRARFRLAVEAGNVRVAQALAADLHAPDRITAQDFARVERNPAAALAKGDFHWAQPSGRDLALYALERAARADAAGVRSAWEKQRQHLPAADRLYGNARLAYHASRQLNPRALEWYREAEGAPLSDVQRAWRIRAGLRSGAWPDVLATIDALPPGEAQEPAWRYWKARALAAEGRPAEANAIYAGLADDVGFYGLLAAEALGRKLELKSAPLTPEADALAAFGARPAVQRVVKLAQLDMRAESQREWIYVVRGLPDEALLLAAEYARREGLYDRAINTADRTASRHDFGLRYMTPFRDEFVQAAREQGVEAALLFGIARQESRFASDIVSSAGAVGLMQLMPPTARWVAKQLNRADYRPSQIADVQVNTQFGAFYFRYWLDRLDGVPALAAAAYNAGPNRAQAWRGGSTLEGAVWVETIPFNETRDYVKRVLANTVLYAYMLNQAYMPLSKRLGYVSPRGGNGDTPVAAAGS